MSDLRGFTAPEPIETGNTGKIFGAVVIALAICAAGTYSYETGMWNSQPATLVADNELPSISTTPPAPPAQPMLAPSAPVQNVPAPTPAQAAAPVIAAPHPQHTLAQHSPRAVLPPDESTTDQSATTQPAPPTSSESAQVPSTAAQASPDAGTEPQPQQDNTPAQAPQQPDNSTPQTPQ